MKLTDLKIGESGYILKIGGSNSFRKRLTEMGFVRGQKIESLFTSPLGNPTTFGIMGYELSLREGESSVIEVSREPLPHQNPDCMVGGCGRQCNKASCQSAGWSQPTTKANTIDVVLIGNPNSGKSSLFNALSGGQERVGNYSGVTVTQKVGHFHYKGYRINIIDLPGTYSLSAYSAEERYVQQFLREGSADVVVNVISASNIKRHLYLTTDLMDRDVRVIGALNMYDELQERGEEIDVEKMSESLGMPLVPVVAKNAKGTTLLLDKIVELIEGSGRPYPHVEVNYGEHLEKEVGKLMESFAKEDLPVQFPLRYWALKMLESDEQVEQTLKRFASYDEWCQIREHSVDHIQREDQIDIPTEITSRKYLFIDELLGRTLKQNVERTQGEDFTLKVDRLVTNKWLGFPIFILLMWLTFSATFTLGAYPQEWIEMGIEMLGEMAGTHMSDGWLRSFIVDGVIGGAGGVLVFLPNIIILYLFIVFLEASGYMVRAAFIMDRLMRYVGLDGHAFIPMLMGFGCNVPAIMATRTIEDSKSRLISILINPFVSCSARLPVFILMAGTFLPQYGALAVTSLYVLGIIVAVATSLVLRRFITVGRDTALILELPPYRMPTLKSVVKQLWYKCERYIKRIGTIILLASAIIWALDYFPAGADDSPQAPESYLSQIGRVTEPVVKPIGLDWRASVSLLSGIAAKEIIVSTMGVLYETENQITEGDEADAIADDFTLPSAIAFMIFVLLYFPCTGTLAAIYGETNRVRWVLFSIIYSTSVAWILAFVAFHVTRFVI
ncbi:MAG: ferrous iron transport protein B [Rikenellaceae bacterium]